MFAICCVHIDMKGDSEACVACLQSEQRGFLRQNIVVKLHNGQIWKNKNKTFLTLSAAKHWRAELKVKIMERWQ